MIHFNFTEEIMLELMKISAKYAPSVVKCMTNYINLVKLMSPTSAYKEPTKTQE